MIELLREGERGALTWYQSETTQVGKKALRIIDAQAARLAELESWSKVDDQQVASLYRQINAASARLADAERKVAAARSFINRHYEGDLSSPECIECIRKALT